MTNEELAAIVMKQQATIDQLAGLVGQRTVEQNLTPLDINNVHVPYVFRPYPRTLYKAQAEPVAKQVDHPGFDRVVAQTAAQHKVFTADGWSDSPEDATAAAKAAESESKRTAKK